MLINSAFCYFRFILKYKRETVVLIDAVRFAVGNILFLRREVFQLRNHYVSQFVIKRFSSAINIFNVNTGKIDESKRPHKVFYKNDIYDEEIEKLVSFNIESRVSNILDRKILGKSKIELTRTEIETLKRYMLICSVRTQDESSFCNFLRGFEKNIDSYINIYNEYSKLPKTKDSNLTDNELYFRTLKVFAKTTNIRDIVNNPLATREMLGWALPFLESYIAFWDTPKDKEYILSDCGMCSEYEGFHMITGGIDISKTSFLFHKIIKEKKSEYGGLLASNFLMYENYSILNLSSTRSMIMINPFFRLYHNVQIFIGGSFGKKCTLEEPDIWPAIIQNKSLFNVPQNKYKIGVGFYTQDDLFIYSPKILTNEDLVYINSLMLSQTKEIIGFNDAKKIIDSIYYFVWHKANFESVKYLGQPDDEVVNNFIENVAKSPFRDLCDYCDSKGGINKTEFIFLFEKLLAYIYKDFYENPYISQYYLDRPDDTANCHQLDFLGKGYKKLEVFKKILNRINEKER